MGGAAGSFHLLGRALDIGGPQDLLPFVATRAKIQRVTPKCTGPVEVLVESDHLHLAW